MGIDDLMQDLFASLDLIDTFEEELVKAVDELYNLVRDMDDADPREIEGYLFDLHTLVLDTEKITREIRSERDRAYRIAKDIDRKLEEEVYDEEEYDDTDKGMEGAQ